MDLKSVLMKRDGMSDKEADEVIRQAKIELLERLENDEDCDYFMEEEFSLENDYVFELM